MKTYQDFLDNKGEQEWQKKWEKNGTFKTPEKVTAKNKYYILPQLPYPSGSGLHVGHAEVYTACDIYARYQRMNKKNVLQVIGWDSFGLPAENYAIKTNVHPRKSTNDAVDNFRSQIKALGISVDWERETASHSPEYYKWTQWFFLLMYKRGLAYRKMQTVNWCESCKTVLANDQVKEGNCERCDTVVDQKEMEQWFLKTTQYADRLLEGLDDLDWPEETKKRQRDWIGRSEGVNFKMKVKGSDVHFEVYDSVPQTYTAQTFVVIAPEHPKLPELVRGTKHEKEVLDFVEKVKKKKKEGNKFEVEQEIDGIFTGLYMDDPYGTGDLPLWVASFAIVDYGSGVVGCSVHDERDFTFAKKFDIPLRPVMFPDDKAEAKKVKNLEYCYHHDVNAVLASPKEFEGRKWGEARDEIIDFLVEKGIATRAVQYKLRDWSISRQRFWGAPIPMLFNEEKKNKKYKYLCIHGFTATSQSVFWNSVKNTLEAQGHEVYCPDLPNTDAPTMNEQVDFIIDNFDLTDDTVILSHSHGAGVAMRLLEKTEKHVAKVVFIDGFIRPEFNDKKRPLVEKSGKWKFDFKKIKTLSDEFVVIGDNKFPVIPKDQLEEMAELFDAQLAYVHAEDEHFKTANEPSLLEYIFVDGWKTVPEEDLPVELPDDVDFKPTGESPLNYSKDFQKGVEKKYGKGWKREPDTLDTFMCSSWYYFRYLDPHNDKEFASPKQLKTWMPVDFYLGGAEHVNGHLLYSRFFTKVLHDAGYIDFDEPFTTHRHQGIILGADHRKMSKRWGNVVNPTDVVDQFGADTCRMYEMFMGPLEDAKPWDTNGVKGVRRFLDKVWKLQEKVSDKASSKQIIKILHQTIKKVGDDTNELRFNTAIAKLMELVNAYSKEESIATSEYKAFLIMLSPFAPHITEELWNRLGNTKSISFEKWPTYDEKKIVEDTITLAVQVNGKVRATMEVAADISEKDAQAQALELENVQKWLDGKKPKKVIYVKGKLISIVV